MVAIISISLLLGCNNNNTPARITYTEHIQPLLAKHCVRCHQAGEIAPFPLEDYHQAKIMANEIKIATANRTMPPYLMDASGTCQNFANHHWLTDDEINLFSQWAYQGMPKGPVRNAALPPKQLNHLTVDSYSLTMANFYSPSLITPDDYRCFPMDTGLVQPAFLTAYEFAPGDSRVVHHMTMYKVDNVTYQNALILSAQSTRLGYSCNGGFRPKNNSQLLLTWAPGTGIIRFPDQSGIRMNARQKVIMVIHYNTTSGSFPDQSTIMLEYKDQVPVEGITSGFANQSFSIPPHQPDYLVSKSFLIRNHFNSDRLLWSVLPHAHGIGSTLDSFLTNTIGRTGQCLSHIPRWDFNWQKMYFYDQPVRLNLNDYVKVDCHYNSSTRSQTTNYGYGSMDEMCILYTYTTPAN